MSAQSRITFSKDAARTVSTCVSAPPPPVEAAASPRAALSPTAVQRSAAPSVGGAHTAEPAVAPSAGGAAAAARPNAADELAAWLARYTPVERAILEARERRLRNRAAQRAAHARRFGDLCEASKGLATVWRAQGFPAADMLAWADGDRFTLGTMLPFLRRRASEEVNTLRRRLMRPLYYARENERRRTLAAERRRIRQHRTENPRPTREAILDAWTHVREGREAMLRFGSLLEDLACYVDAHLRFSDGRIVGRAPGIKGWLQENIPALALRYTTVMRYKAAARKLRQIVELPEPIPVAAVLGGGDAPEEKRDYGAEKFNGAGVQGREMALLRARGVYLEAMEGVPDVVTRVLARLDALLDPARIEAATMLASWRARYARAITPRTAKTWRARLFRRVG